MNYRILRLPEVKARTGLSRSTIYLRMSKNEFPSSILLGGERAVGWIETEINDWLQQQVAKCSNRDHVMCCGQMSSDATDCEGGQENAK